MNKPTPGTLCVLVTAKHAGPSGTKGARVRVQRGNHPARFFPWQHELSPEENFRCRAHEIFGECAIAPREVSYGSTLNGMYFFAFELRRETRSV